MTFIGRDRELALLERRYASDSFECVIVYGRRRIGKTTLIRQFTGNKSTIFFSALESTIERNLDALSRSIGASSPNPNEYGFYPIFDSFEAAIEHIFALAQHQRLILVIDEYPYLAQSDRTVSSILQHAIDRHKDDSKLMIVLSGSSMSFMERQVLGYASPLYGRRTAQIKVEPFDFYTSRQFLPHWNKQDQAIAYGLTGGVPQYLRQIDASLTVEDNIATNILDPGCYLFEEPGNLLQQELRHPAEYANVIQAVASGSSRMNEITTACHISTSACTGYLRNLIDLGLIHRETPFGQDSPRKTIYRIVDSFFRFWYRYLPINMSLIQSGHQELAARHVMQDLSNFMGPVFEQICHQWLNRHNGEDLPFLFLQSGRWWGTDPRTRRQEEIDIVADDGNDHALFAECKWRNEPVGERELHTLITRAELFHHADKHYYLFSKSGFTEALHDTAADDRRVHLIAFDDME